MTPIHHGQFTLERRYRASPKRVYAAWSEIGARAQWFVGPGGWRELRREMDFRIGGHELVEGRFPEGRVSRYTARFHALTPASRIVLVYDMHLNDVHHSTSLATVELAPVPEGTRLIFTEHVAFLDGTTSVASREQGTDYLLGSLRNYLMSK